MKISLNTFILFASRKSLHECYLCRYEMPVHWKKKWKANDSTTISFMWVYRTGKTKIVPNLFLFTKLRQKKCDVPVHLLLNVHLSLTIFLLKTLQRPFFIVFFLFLYCIFEYMRLCEKLRWPIFNISVK